MNALKDHTDIPTCSKVYQVPMATKTSNGNKQFHWQQKFQWQQKLNSKGNLAPMET